MQQNVHELVKFVTEARSKGMPDEDIIEAAQAIGLWNDALIRAAVAGVDLSHFATPPPSPTEDFETVDGTVDEDFDFMDEDHFEDTSDYSWDDAPEDHEIYDTPPPITAQTAVYGAPGAGRHYKQQQSEQSHQQHYQQHNYEYTAPPYYAQQQRKEAEKQSLPILPAVIHHVSLWVFLLFSIPAIVYLVNFLFSENSNFGRLTTLTTFAAIIIVSGGVYATMYGAYLRKTRDNPNLRTGKVFAVLTITGSTIGAIISGIVLLNGIINYQLLGEKDALSTILSALLVTAVFIATIITYHATDIRDATNPARKRLSRIAPLMTAIILLGLFIFSAIAMPGAVSDKKAVDGLVETTESVREYAEDHNALPDAVAFQSLDTADNVRYEYVSDYEYRLCADFQQDNSEGYRLHMIEEDYYDDSVGEWTFNTYTKGENCFNLKNRELYDQSQNIFEPLPVPRPHPTPYPLPIEPTPEPYMEQNNL